MRKKHFYILLSLFILFASCISNDLPYPYIPGEIQEISVKGQVGNSTIDPITRSVAITINEYAELDSVVITKLIANAESKIIPEKNVSVKPDAFPDFSFTSLLDLPGNANTAINAKSPAKLLLQTYQDYIWTLNIEQKIERSIIVENQVGTPIIDENNKIIVIYVSPEQKLDNVTIKEMNIEGKNSRLFPEATNIHDFSKPQEFAAFRTNNNKEKFIAKWTVDVIQTTDTGGTSDDVEIWATKAVVKGGMRSGATPEVEYKKEVETTWLQLPSSQIVIESPVSFRATIDNLENGTTYEWRVVVDGTPSASSKIETEKIETIPNLNFDIWTQDKKNWYANAVSGNYDQTGAYWATGNEGVTSNLAGGKDPITTPVEGSEAYKGKAAKLKSITGVNLVGAAAGNLFIGKYKTNATSPSSSVEFGRPFSGARPTKMIGYYRYYPAKITNNGTLPGNLVMDQGHIYIRLWDKDGREIAYGEEVINDKVDNYKKFEITIDYKNLTAKPAMITIVATSSRYGGEFSGAKVIGQVGDGSILYVDEFELIYD